MNALYLLRKPVLIASLLLAATSVRSQWGLTGNSIAAGQFLGTNNARNLSIHTNGSEKMMINTAGQVRIGGTGSPTGMLDVHGTIMVSPTSDGTPGGNSIYLLQDPLNINHGGDIHFVDINTNQAWDVIQGDNCGVSGENLNFLYYPNNATSCTNFVRALTLFSGSGNVGIHTASATATLHVSGSVRFQNLPSGTGTNLVIDANGNIYRSSQALNAENDSLKNKVNMLEKQLKSLQQNISKMQLAVNKINKLNKPSLAQNYPNPFKNQTVISFFVPEDAKNAKILIFDEMGREISNATLKGRGKQHLTIKGNKLSPGMYYYSLLVDGKKIDSKKMAFSK